MGSGESKLEKGFIKVLTIITAISIAVNIILLLKRGEAFPSKKELILENTKLVKQLYEYKTDLNKYKGISQKIDRVIKDANEKIEAKEIMIDKLSRKEKIRERENKRLLFEVDSIKELYLNVIDSLLIERSEKRAINNKLANYKDIITELNKQIGVASYLTADNINVTPLKIQSSGSKTPTLLARRVKDIEVCLDILENRISRKGKRDLFFLLTSPTGELIVDGGGDPVKFYYSENNIPGECSKVGQIDYKNKKVNYCININPGSNLESGLYVLEVYTNENSLGMITFSLK